MIYSSPANFKKYKHIKTGLIAEVHEYKSYSGIVIPSEIIKNSNEWELVEALWELKSNIKQKIYFRNTFTGLEYHIGDEVTMKNDNSSFGDEIRNHVISGFHLPFSYNTSSTFKNILVSFEGYNSYDRTLTLDEIVKIK